MRARDGDGDGGVVVVVGGRRIEEAERGLV